VTAIKIIVITIISNSKFSTKERGGAVGEMFYFEV